MTNQKTTPIIPYRDNPPPTVLLRHFAKNHQKNTPWGEP